MSDIKNYQMLINGKWVNASDKSSFNSINPTTGNVWCTVPEATIDDVNTAVNAADKAFNSGPWAGMSPTARGHCLHRLADLLAEHSESLGKIECIDTGKMYKETRWQAQYISEFFHFYAGCADKIHDFWRQTNCWRQNCFGANTFFGAKQFASAKKCFGCIVSKGLKPRRVCFTCNLRSIGTKT